MNRVICLFQMQRWKIKIFPDTSKAFSTFDAYCHIPEQINFQGGTIIGKKTAFQPTVEADFSYATAFYPNKVKTTQPP